MTRFLGKVPFALSTSCFSVTRPHGQCVNFILMKWARTAYYCEVPILVHTWSSRTTLPNSLDINLCMDFSDTSNNRWPVILNLLVFFISATIPRKFRIDLLVLVIQLLLRFFCFNDGLKSSPTCTWRNCHMISTSLSSPAIDFYGNVFSAVFISRKFDITSDGLASVFIQQFVRKIIKNCSSFRSKGR